MRVHLDSGSASKSMNSKQISLRFVLVIPFVVQIFAAVGLTGYLSLRNGQKAVNDLAIRLRKEVSARIAQHLNSYMQYPQKVVKVNSDAINMSLLNLEDREELGEFFWKQVEPFNVGYVIFGFKTGEYIAAGRFLDNSSVTIDEISPQIHNGSTHLYTWETDNEGRRTKVAADNGEFNLHKEGWYQEAVKQGKTVWSPVYNWEVEPFHLSIATSHPIYNQNKSLVGVIAAEQRLSQISEFLRELKVSESGKTFVIERNGLLIASSAEEKPFNIVNGKPQRIKAISSKDPLIKATAEHLEEEFGDLNKIKNIKQLEFQLNGKRKFVQVTPWRDELGLDWLMIVTVPEEDFMEKINSNRNATIMLCFLALGLAIVVGFYTSRWITNQF